MSEYVKNTIISYRKIADITQEDLASAVGVSRQTIIAMEKGNYAPSILLALKIATYFKVPVEHIFAMSYEK